MKVLLLAVVYIYLLLPVSAQSNGGMTWLSPESRHNLELLERYIEQAPYFGLYKNDYQPAFFRSLLDSTLSLSTAADTAVMEAQVSKTALQFFNDIAYGSLVRPPVKYNGPPYDPVCDNSIADSLALYLSTGRFSSFLAAVEPSTPEYLAMKNKIAFFRDRLADSSFIDTTVTGLNVDTSNKRLLARLTQFGILDRGVADTITNRELQQRLAIAQRMFNLLPDGTLRGNVLRALNVPFATRLHELELAINQLRWLRCARQRFPVVIVNIPSCGLTLYQQGKPTLFSRVVVGKRSNPTPTLCSRIDEVVVYPYWTVPHKIATRELLPHIKQDIGYLEANQFEVLDRKGRIIDPAKVNWHALHPGNFPYVLRQGTGCDNSLGIVKLDFYNPYTVYLHDTPWKSLFMLNQRFFSHGCIRVEDAVPLARLLLRDTAADMDALIAKGWKPGQKPVNIHLPETTYVFVLYNTAWTDENGNVRFYADEYRLLE